MHAFAWCGGGDGGSRQSVALRASAWLTVPLAVVMLVATPAAVESRVVPASERLMLQPNGDVPVFKKASSAGSWLQVLLAEQQDDAVPIRRHYKQLFEYDMESPVALATAAQSPETKEKYSGELDDAGKPVIISHNFKEHHLSAKDRQRIFEAPYNFLSANDEFAYYRIASPFRRREFRLPKDPLILTTNA